METLNYWQGNIIQNRVASFGKAYEDIRQRSDFNGNVGFGGWRERWVDAKM